MADRRSRQRSPEVEARARERKHARLFYQRFKAMRDELELPPTATLHDVIQVHRAQAAGEVLKVLQAHRAGDPNFLNVYGDD